MTTPPTDIAKVPITKVSDAVVPTPAVARGRDAAPLRSWAEMRAEQLD
jgi:hypothetical protein